MKAIIILNYASEEDIGKKTSIRLANEENKWIEEVVIKPMPEKKYTVEDDGLSPTDQILIQSGWNACIEEIQNESRMDK